MQTEATSDTGGGNNIGFIEHGDYISFERVNLEETTGIRFRVASAGSGGTIQLRLDAPDGQLVGETAFINADRRLAELDRTSTWRCPTRPRARTSCSSCSTTRRRATTR